VVQYHKGVKMKKKTKKIVKSVVVVSLIILLLLGVFFGLRACDDDSLEQQESGVVSSVDCVTNDDCDFTREQCENGVCVAWNPLEGYV
jgi:hypothetical protein